jgi:hypothetical protein
LRLKKVLSKIPTFVIQIPKHHFLKAIPSFLTDKLDRANQNLKQNKTFLDRLKKKKPKDLDQRFHQLHEEAFEEIDCLDCGNCCKTTSPIFQQKDIERMAKHFKMRPAEFVTQYLVEDEENDFVFPSAPCPFLADDNYCMAYEARPNACREYPHTDRRKMHQILSLTHKNTLVCPAVSDIVEQIKVNYANR